MTQAILARNPAAKAKAVTAVGFGAKRDGTMKRASSAVAAVTTGLALSLSLASFAAKSSGDAPVVASLASMMEGLKWGVNHAEVARVYNTTGGLFDQEYDPVLAKMQPGVRMQALEADRENRKSAFASSFLEFKDTPTGYDATSLKGEFTYKNHEEIMSLEKDGKRRYFFFIGSPPGERLWKIYDEIPLNASGSLGPTYRDAVTKLNTTLGVSARIRAADTSQGLYFTTADWQDSTSHLRAIDRSFEHIVGVVIEDRQTLGALPQLRSNKVDDPLAMDPSITAITRGGVADPSARTSPDAGKPKK
jgi:hypothetical protein